MRLDNNIALITGGSLGIGRAIALRFAREGAKVAISGRNRASLEEAAGMIREQGGEVLTLESDVQDQDQVNRKIDQILDKWGRIDVLVHNAGINNPTPFLEITAEEWDRHININLKGAFLVSQRVCKEMTKQQQKGSVILMSSVNGLAAEADLAHYNASKGGLNMLAMSMALELAPLSIRVNSLCPGFIETRLTKPVIDNAPAIQEYLRTIPMGRVGQPDEVADVALFLASEESRYITGHCMVVDGGQMIKLS
jgi:NAD(P)-dependent dehydrogenase (short-subunit alcohol dehydrogenase family)